VELHRAADELGIHQVYWFGYKDSGMTGWEQNHAPEALWAADVEVAGAQLADILRSEAADVLVAYDWHGNYGHPDHVQVHRVGHAAARLAGTPKVFEATMNRDAIRMFMNMAVEGGDERAFDPDGPADDGNPFGTPEAELTTAVDVSGYVKQKRASIAHHASQVSDSSMFLSMPDEVFAVAFGTEWFIEVGAPAGIGSSWLLD
jgi:LmbE family N-acetylglucosaminyl deacetylase